MTESKLFHFLRVLDKSQWQECVVELIDSQKLTPTCSALLKHIDRYKRNLNHSNLSYSYILGNLCIGKSKKYVQNELSKILKALENKIANYELERDSRTKDQLMLNFLLRNGLIEEYDRRLNRNLERVKNQSIDQWTNFYLYEVLHRRYYSNHPIKYESGHSELQKMQKTLKQAYVDLSLFHKFSFENRKWLHNEEVNELETSDKNIYQYSSFQQTINIAINLLKTDRTESAVFLKDLLYDDNNSLSNEILHFICLNLMNHYRRMISRGYLTYVKGIHEINKRMDKLNIMTQNNILSNQRFINAITIALSPAINDIDWYHSFTKRYKNKLITNHKNTLLEISEIKLLMYKKKYEKALNRLNKLSSTDLSLKLRIYLETIICQYECHKDEPNYLKSVYANKINYIRRHQNDYSERIVLGSLNTLKVLIRLLNNDNAIDLAEYNMLSYQYWLIEKLEEKRPSLSDSPS